MWILAASSGKSWKLLSPSHSPTHITVKLLSSSLGSFPRLYYKLCFTGKPLQKEVAGSGFEPGTPWFSVMLDAFLAVPRGFRTRPFRPDSLLLSCWMFQHVAPGYGQTTVKLGQHTTRYGRRIPVPLLLLPQHVGQALDQYQLYLRTSIIQQGTEVQLAGVCTRETR